MAFLVLLSVAQLINTIESSSCSPKEFTETPIEVQNSCSRENIENRWRGELSYTRTETHIEVDWKKIVQDSVCVKAMEFFVDGVKQPDHWGKHKESVRIYKSGEFSLKVEVYFVNFLIPVQISSSCYGIPGRECKCFEATKKLIVPGNGNGNNEDGSTSPLTVAAASGGVILFLALLLTLAICIVKHRRNKEKKRREKAPKVDVNDMYGTYATSGKQSDYSTVQDTNDYYG